jgi:hypothetical protein
MDAPHNDENAVSVARKCTRCGHEESLSPVVSHIESDGTRTDYFSSRYDFCIECEGPMGEPSDKTPAVQSMTPEMMALVVALHYARTQAMTPEACEPFDRRRVLVTDHMHEDHARGEKSPGAILQDLCGRGANMDEQSLAVVESAWALFHFSRFPEEQQKAIRLRAEAIYVFLSELDKPAPVQEGDH